MKQKICYYLVVCLLLSLPFWAQAVHAKPTDEQTKKIYLGESITVEGNSPDNVVNLFKGNAANWVNGQIKFTQPIFIRDSVTVSGAVSGDEQNRPKLYLQWLTISMENVTFENLDIEGKIQITARANVTFKNCTINGMPSNEVSVEAFAGSSCNFDNCILQGDSEKPIVCVRDAASGNFSNCTISNTKGYGLLFMRSRCNNTGLLLMGSSRNNTITRCKFLNCPKSAIFLSENAVAKIDECEFEDLKAFKGAPAIYAQTSCEATVRKSKFSKCKGPAILCVDSSKVDVSECNFNMIVSPGYVIRGNNESQLLVSHCNFKDIKGNGVTYDNSKGKILNCSFDTFANAAIAILGTNSNPKISNCVINREDLSSIVIKDGAEPILEDITFKEFTSKSPLISCSGFSKPTITGLKFESSGQFPRILVYDEAVIKDKYMTNRGLKMLNYPGATGYRSMLKDENFMNQFDPSRYIVVEEKTGGKLSKLFPDFDVNACNQLFNAPQNANMNLPEDSENSKKFVFSSCGHPAVSIDSVSGQLIRACDQSATYSCPLCEIPKQKLSQVREEEQCALCLDKPATCIALPCGHKCICEECCKDPYYFQHSKKLCLTCLQRVVRFQYDFFNNHK